MNYGESSHQFDDYHDYDRIITKLQRNFEEFACNHGVMIDKEVIWRSFINGLPTTVDILVVEQNKETIMGVC